MPATHGLVEVKLPEAAELADLYGIEHDLVNVQHYCARALEFADPPHPDYLMVEALISAAVVRYFRCFPDRVGVSLTRSDIAQLAPEFFDLHEYYKKLRDKFIAHSVNPFEDSYVTVSVTERDGKKYPVESVNPGFHRFLLSRKDAKSLIHLVNGVIDLVRTRIEVEERKLLALLQSLPVDVIHAGDLHTPNRITVADVGKRRKRRTKPVANKR